MAINKPERCSVQEEGDANSPFVSWRNRNTRPQTSRSLKTHFVLIDHALNALIMKGTLPSVFPRPVLTLAVFTWLMRPSCSGFTNTASLIFQRHCTATYRTRNHITIDNENSFQPDKHIKTSSNPVTEQLILQNRPVLQEVSLSLQITCFCKIKYSQIHVKTIIYNH